MITSRLELVRFVILTSREGVAEYEKGEPTYCPVCRALGLYLIPAKTTRSDGQVRYHTCRQCQNTFKSIEKLDNPVFVDDPPPPPPPPPPPEKMIIAEDLSKKARKNSKKRGYIRSKS